jgi:hypothetical protein
MASVHPDHHQRLKDKEAADESREVSIVASQPLLNPNAGRIAAAMTMPVASPARQCISLFTPCFQLARVKASCAPGNGRRHAMRYSANPTTPV